MQHGFGGMLRGAGIVFFAFIGFDAVSTAAQETKNPGRDMPKGILGSLAIVRTLHVQLGRGASVARGRTTISAYEPLATRLDPKLVARLVEPEAPLPGPTS